MQGFFALYLKDEKNKVVILLILCCLKCFAQEPLYKNIVYAEGLGNGVLYSINYEKLIYKKFGYQNYLRLGFGFKRDTDWQYLSPNKSNLGYFIPLMFVNQFGVKRLKYEIGLGLLTVAGEPIRRSNIIAGTGNSNVDFGITGSLGLRYVCKKAPVFLKLCYTPFYSFTDKSGIYYWLGISVGYAFKPTKVSYRRKTDEMPDNTGITLSNYTGVTFSNGKVIYRAKKIKPTYPDSTKKVYYSIILNYPTTRTNGWSVGLERCQKINNFLSFTSSFSAIVQPVSNTRPAKYPEALYTAFCFQPFHLLIGKKRLKFETGLSVSYINADINNSPNTSIQKGYAKDKFIYNIYFGMRYNFKKIPFHTHLAYVPYFDPYEHKRYYGPAFQPIGFEFGIGYILHKNAAAQKRKAIRKRVKEY